MANFDLGSLISGALSGAQEAVERILVQFEANTKDLEEGIARVDAAVAKSDAAHADALNKYRAQKAEVQKLIFAEETAEKRLTDLKQVNSLMRTAAQQREIASLEQRIPIMRMTIEQAQMEESRLLAASRALATHTRQLEADAAALRTHQAAGGAPGVSVGGAAVLGGVGALGGMLALNAVMALGRAVEETMTAYVKWGHEVEHTSALLGTSAENASVLLYTFQRFNLDTAAADRAIIQLSRHVEENEDKFRKLGVTTRNSNGEFKDAFDIFTQVQGVLSKSADGITKNTDMMELLARASSGGGQSFAELNAILNLTPAQMAAVRAEAQRMGFVLDDGAAKKAFALQNQMVGLHQSLRGLQVSVSQFAAPALNVFITKITEAIGAVQYLASATGSLSDKIGGYFGIGPLAAGAEAAAQRAVADAKAIGEALDKGGGAPPDVSNAAMKSAQQAATDAIRDRIQAIREEAQAQQDAMREELSNFEATKAKETEAWKALEAEQRRTHQDEIDATEDQTRAEERATNARITAIEDAARTATAAYDLRQRQRDDDIRGLREQLSVMEEGWREQDARAQIAVDRANLDKAKAHEVFRAKGMSAEQYAEAVFRHNSTIAAAEKRLADEQTKLSRDVQKAAIEEKVKAAEKIAAQDKRALEDSKRASDEQIRQLRALMATDKQRSDDAIRGIRDQMKADKDRSDAALKAIKDEVAANKDRTEDAIKQLQRATQALVKGLEEELKAHERAASGIAGAYVPAFNKVKKAADDAAVSISKVRDIPPVDVRTATERGNMDPRLKPTGLEDLERIWGDLTDFFTKHTTLGQGIGQNLAGIHDYPHAMTLTEPTALVSSRGVVGMAAVRGPESVSFGGVAGQASDDTHIINVGVYVDGEPVRAKIIKSIANSARRGFDLQRRA